MARIRPETGSSTLELELSKIREAIAASPYTAGSKRKYDEVLGRFEAFLMHGLGLRQLVEVTPEQVGEFVRAPAGPTFPVSTGTMHVRRSALRLAFRLARERGLLEHDPTLDLALPPRRGERCRPLLDAEVERCRSASLHSVSETRLPTAWALAEATATPSEIALVRPADVALETMRVRLVGGGHLSQRWGLLTGWGAAQLERRIQLQYDVGGGLVYRGHGSDNSAQASASQAIRWSLIRAGFGADPRVKPSSVRAWRARRWADEQLPIQEIAARLGMRSLDRVMALIADEDR